MNKLDYIDMQLEGNGTLQEIFERMGAYEFQTELENAEAVTTNAELKTTSVRLSPSLLDSLDAVNKRFEITRQDAFTYMVAEYIASSVANYAFGRVKSMIDNGVKGEPMELYREEWEALITSLPCDDATKTEVRRLSHSHAIFYLKDIGGI